ncbi:MAG: hypothetical protein KF903_08800 [Dokdonella sp.]|uniref:hypothetical protein n=1 Tax=Dokdonella sp. TaxID=2291710 RepID=UPI0025C692D5|nr:hypothetical protein [Dokdonella sp.]MBX3701079.1 hypothetical protein [Dokdonella sp.]
MASCGACGTTILFGGRDYAGMRFCSEKCAANGRVAIAAQRVPDAEALLLASQIHAEKCPKCAGPGPVDMRASYKVWSAVFMTRWASASQVACRRCGIRKQSLSALGSLIFGWWGFPWGLIMTPVQLFRNIAAIVKPHDPARPSPQLIQHSRLLLADRMLESQV